MIFCVEDDMGIRELVVYTLNNSGFDAAGFESGAGLWEALAEQTPELILLDIMLPDEDGVTILKKLRADTATRMIPVIMLTARGTEYDKVMGLDSGADDYITKPFGMTELISRIRAVLRRTRNDPGTGDAVRAGGVVMDLRAHTVTSDGDEVSLTLKEYELLLMLITNAGRVMSRDILLEKIWGYEYYGETRTVDVHIRTLRSKLGNNGEIIETVRGVGYRVSAAVKAQ
ncbi:MAG: response regulator transcription factor [Eubacteriales bacterium]|jgi:two-component system alkaline phosphatase synthesis response regulator PhoP|nr:response regulator transcription factor [Eubacteriales bacterium]